MSINKYKFYLISLCASIALLGCGGGSNSATSVVETTTVTGLVADGYLVGAKVCIDKNYNDACDTDEPFVLTDATGRYTFTLNANAATEFPLIVDANESVIDLDTNAPIGQKWTFKATSTQQNFISPLTTLVAYERDLNTSLTLEQAMENLKTSLGIDINTSVDYVADNNTKAHNAAKIIARSLAVAETNLTTAASTVGITDKRLIRLLAAKQVREKVGEIATNADSNNTTYLCDINTSNIATQLSDINTTLSSSISDELKADLLFMWEEEKLARDVYLTLYEKWGTRVFTNIANNSEQTHMDSIKAMITKYNVPMGARVDTRGVYVDSNLTALYTTLIAQGTTSLSEAYAVGRTIENVDIADLNTRLAKTGLPADIKQVYENLRSGSYNHLAAFSKY